MTCIISSKDFNIWIDEQHILKDINICIPKGKLTIIVGPSGSGKTTLLRSFNRLIELYSNVKITGDIFVDNTSIFKMDPRKLRSIMGMVFQAPNPFPHLSIYDNVALPAKINGIKGKSKIDEIVKWALEKAGLWNEVKDRIHEYPQVLSGGQRQRLCIARALAMKPQILLLDEPTANIDPINTTKIEETLKELKEEMSIVMVTHNPLQALRLGDYIIVIYDGKIIEEGDVNNIALNARNEITIKILRGAS